MSSLEKAVMLFVVIGNLYNGFVIIMKNSSWLRSHLPWARHLYFMTKHAEKELAGRSQTSLRGGVAIGVGLQVLTLALLWYLLFGTNFYFH